jgi:hypothetical protein
MRACKELRLPCGQVAARLGYRNLSKGARRLEQVSCGDLADKEALLAKLPRALDLAEEVVGAALEETRSQIEREIQAEFECKEARWRARFRPHALISTGQSVPSPIFVAIFIGPERLKWMKFDASHRRDRRKRPVGPQHIEAQVGVGDVADEVVDDRHAGRPDPWLDFSGPHDTPR